MTEENKMQLQQLAEKVFALQSFSHKTLADAKQTVEVGPYKMRFDAFSLAHYFHNLSEDEYSFYKSSLRRICEESLSREGIKELSERLSLMIYLGCESPFKEYEIEKTTRPDFILHGEKTVGIEVVRFTTKEDKILHDISNKNFGKNLSLEEIKANAYKKHKSNALRYSFNELDGHVYISTGLLNCTNRIEHYILLLQSKYDKYEHILKNFDEFIILCDALYCLEITSHEDAINIVEQFKALNSDLPRFKIVILWQDDRIKASTFFL